MAAKIRYGDEVIILIGKNKGKCGKVKKILSNNKAIVEGINLVKKHQKPIPSANQLGGIINKEAEIHISNLAIFNFITKKADRIKFKIIDEKKVRIFKSTNEIVKR